MKIGMAPFFHSDIAMTDRLIDCDRLQLSTEDIDYNNDICFFYISELLRKQWWLNAAIELADELPYQPNFDRFVLNFKEFAHYKGLPFNLYHEFGIIITEPSQDLHVNHHGNIAAFVNLSDDAVIFSIDGEKIAFNPSEGCTLPKNVEIKLLKNNHQNDIRALCVIKKTHSKSLKPGTRVLDLVKDHCIEERVAINNGTCMADQEKSTFSYVNDAYIPLLPFSGVNRTDMSKLVMPDYEPIAPDPVMIASVPESIVDPFFQLGISNIIDEQHLIKIINSDDGKQALHAAKEYYSQFSDKTCEIDTRLVYNLPNTPSATQCSTSKKLLGLHIDHANNQSLFTKIVTSNRISINLSNQDRYFLFVNIPLHEIVLLVNAQRGDSYHQCVKKFLSLYPNYPVVRITIRPGEAYFAPTQNIIHDGIGPQKCADVHLTFCGYFDPKCFYETAYGI